MNFFKRVFFLSFALFFLTLKISAQVPGYMGKKTVIGYGFYFNPAFNNIVYKYSNKKINTFHEFFLERVTRTKVVTGFSLKLYKYRYENIENVDYTQNVPPGFIGSQSNPGGHYDIKGKNYSLYWKFYRRGYLAPWGKYFTAGLTLYTYKTIYNPYEMNIALQRKTYVNNSYSYEDLVFDDFGPLTQNFKKFDFFFGSGNSRVFYNNIYFNYGYTINVIATLRPVINILSDEWEGYSTNEYSSGTYIESTAGKRVQAVNKFNVFVKVGYLF